MKLREYMQEHKIEAEHLSFTRSCHTVKEAAEAAGAREDQLVKNICFTDGEKLVVAIVKGEDRVDTKKVETASGRHHLKKANPAQILEMSGYPCGGVPSFGYQAIILIDPKVMEMDMVYTGGGTDKSLVRISPAELVRASGGIVVEIRQGSLPGHQ